MVDQPTREDLQSLLAAVRKDQGGFRAGLSPAESEYVLVAFLDLQAKFTRAVSCR